ncbi:serine threonine protein kinase [Colletotrichum plurivorum]|uniref:Serine threonine protein kinase n=1 Tax=Colletotrichum plurivorum TaxID=2175906 RepID=A0A8H6JY26_9PEZI|nr:serine threonine protein kinase [Colletotrichum plurivorum]
MKELYGPQLARLLHTAGEHSFRTLPFNSYAWDAEKAQYMYLFDYPPNTSDRQPKSLNDFILSSKLEPKYKLELKQRFFVAQTIARAIGAFHSDGWLHKSIRAHAVKFFFLPDGKTCDFGNPYLTDFEFSRPLAGVTRLIAQAVDLDHEVYRHPDRHGLPDTSFSRMHDIYSLGVVLLEIGLWQTARQVHDDVVKYELDGDAKALQPQQIKQAFLQDAKERLAHRMGTAYQEAAIACLDGDWDEFVGSRDFAQEFYKRVVLKVDIKAFIS